MSSASLALTKFAMPAMSPTMTEGGIAAWKKKVGESYSAGDVLLEIVSMMFMNLYFRFRKAEAELSRSWPCRGGFRSRKISESNRRLEVDLNRTHLLQKRERGQAQNSSISVILLARMLPLF